MNAWQRLRWASQPVPGRSSMLLWGGMAALLGGGALLMQAELPGIVGFLVYLVIVAGWIAAACGAVGYVRWLFRQNIKEAGKE
jgi:hypothetical protein